MTTCCQRHAVLYRRTGVGHTSSISLCIPTLLTACTKCYESGRRSTWVGQSYNGKPAFHRLLLARHVSETHLVPGAPFPCTREPSAYVRTMDFLHSLLTISESTGFAYAAGTCPVLISLFALSAISGARVSFSQARAIRLPVEVSVDLYFPKLLSGTRPVSANWWDAYNLYCGVTVQNDVSAKSDPKHLQGKLPERVVDENCPVPAILPRLSHFPALLFAWCCNRQS